MIIPERLKKGGGIGFVSPSAGLAPFAMHRIDRAKKYFEQEGYPVTMGRHALENAGYISASPEDRARDLMDMFENRNIACIMATIGGNHANQILPFIDWEMVRKNPKIFIGYSDISVLHYAIGSQADLRTYYGPCAMTQFGENPKIYDYTWEYFKKAITEDHKGEGLNVVASDFWTDESSLDWFKKDDLIRPRTTYHGEGYAWWREGVAKAPIIGGCIPSINHLLGTKYWVNPEGHILFLDIPEGHSIHEGLPVDELDSYLADLYNVGVFEKISGLVIGRPYHYSNEDIGSLKELLMDRYCKDKKYPILANANIGHVDPVITIPLGANAVIDSGKGVFTLS